MVVGPCIKVKIVINKLQNRATQNNSRIINVRTRFGAQAQSVNGYWSNEPSTMNL